MIILPFSVGISPTLHIRGLIATRDIKKNEVIEKCPLILVSRKNEEAFLRKTVLWKYYYDYSENYHCIVLGYGSLINHSYAPSARYTFDYKNIRIVYRAYRCIHKGEEITVNYNFLPDSLEKINDELSDYNIHYQINK